MTDEIIINKEETKKRIYDIQAILNPLTEVERAYILSAVKRNYWRVHTFKIMAEESKNLMGNPSFQDYVKKLGGMF